MATAVMSRFGAPVDQPLDVRPVEPILSSTTTSSAAAEVSDSWRRCMADHRVDPRSQTAPNVITQSELKVSSEPLADLIVHAGEEIDRLYAIVRQQGYVVLLCNSEGVAVHHRGDEARADDFKRWGIWLGGVWSEQIEGTNGIGTCITEQRPILVHCGQHYRTRHNKLTCAGAPIFDPVGKLAGVLDVSAVIWEGSDRTQQLALAATIASARAVEERLFREFFRYAWIIAALPCDGSGPALLLATDEDQRVIGADHVARLAFSLTDRNLSVGLHLTAIFDYSHSLFRRGSAQDIPSVLTQTGGQGRWQTLLTPPLSRSRVSHTSSESIVHAQPRIAKLGNLPSTDVPRLNRGGLSPALTHRICKYIESHFDERISLEALASMAGLSAHHFARAFRQSVGTPPHGYLLQRRLEHVEHLLRDTQLPLSQIALAVGFSDQSHLTRHFRRLTGMPPSLARRLER
jgi:transcriptional regulator of acetoin/glycerol metabolism/AraC-like DNA-binding protein